MVIVCIRVHSSPVFLPPPDARLLATSRLGPSKTRQWHTCTIFSVACILYSTNTSVSNRPYSAPRLSTSKKSYPPPVRSKSKPSALLHRPYSNQSTTYLLRNRIHQRLNMRRHLLWPNPIQIPKSSRTQHKQKALTNGITLASTTLTFPVPHTFNSPSTTPPFSLVPIAAVPTG